MKRYALIIVAFLGVVAATPHPAHAASPDLNLVTPRGAQRGTEAQVRFVGNRLGDAQEVIFYQRGIEVTKLEAADNGRSVNVTFKIAEDAPLGEHIMRMRTATGVSEARTFWVGALPVVDEKEPNNGFDSPQPVPFNSTIHGVVQNEDVDYFIIEAKKGDRITAEVEGMRLGRTMFDPYVAIMDMKRFELATSDDTALLLQDPTASIEAPADGQYVILVREASYGGNGASDYRLHIGALPRPLAAYPAGGQAGTDTEITLIGDVKGDMKQTVKLPASPTPSFPVFATDGGHIAPSANFIRVSPYPNVLEVEPNNSRGEATEAIDPVIPVALNGIIQEDGDEDWFKIRAVRGRQFDVRVHAQSIGSPLDSVLYIYAADGSRLATNDDQGGPDSQVRFNPPADGEYFIRVRDHLGKGGPTYVYRVEFTPVEPGVYTHIPEYAQNRNNQERQTIVVPRGNRYATWVRVQRDNVGGDMQLYADNLPAGVEMHADVIAGNVDRVPVVFEAAPDAAVGGALGDIIAKHVDEKQNVAGGFRQSLDLVFGAPNNTVYYGSRVDRIVYAVAEEAPFKIHIEQPKAPIVQNGQMQIKVVAERKEGFTKPITLRMLWNPPGIGSAGTVTIGEGKDEVLYPINAAGNAQTRTWKIAILGSADGGDGAVWVSTQLADLAVEEPYVAMKINMAAAEQGQAASLVCELEQRRPFDGQATVTLNGLPARVTAEATEKQITQDDKELVFALQTDEKSPTGQHKSLFCQVVIQVNGEPVFHSVGGGGILRIDPPPPPKKDEPKQVAEAPKKEEPKKPAPPPERRLSRLEQLRLAAEEARKQEQK